VDLLDSLLLERLMNHVLEVISAASIKQVTQPLPIKLVPILLIGKIILHCRMISSELEERFAGQTFSVRNTSNFDIGSLHTLQ
jgi:hypothetical protein